MTQFYPLKVAAISSTVIIRTVQPFSLSVVDGAIKKDASSEFVEIGNISNQTINMTGWSLHYLSTSVSSEPKLMQTIKPALGMHVTMLDSLGRDTFISSGYAVSNGIVSSLQFNSTLSDTAGNVILFNILHQEVDRVGWRTGSNSNTKAEGDAVLITTGSSTIQRVGADTDNNVDDFKVLPLDTEQDYTFGGLYDLADVCSNLEGIQEVAPDGMVAYDDGTCEEIDRCANIPEVQIEVPEFFERQADGTCTEIDLCPNLENYQHTVPPSYERNDALCVPAFVAGQVEITEVFPNPAGADAGNEFLELYNAGKETVNLSDYILDMSGKVIHFPSAKLLLPGTYITLSDEELDIVFPNTTGIEMSIVAKNGVITSTSPAYASAPVGQSWALGGEGWAYTNQPTRGIENRPMMHIDDEEINEQITLAPCASNQYRSPETNRCRLLATRNGATLTPCKEGQYRSEETNRCRSIVQTVAASLKPCSDDQFRNPATGRCKKIASADDFLQPCDAGWERNTETNRCRKIKASSLPLAAFPVQKTDPTSGSMTMILTVASIIAGALGYAAWEWRYEAFGLLKRLLKR